MDSYEMDMSPPPDAGVADSKKISFRFCRECSNMLYPKEDRENNTLQFACRTCNYSEPATASCIYRNMLKDEIAETAGNVEDVAQDPTVGDSGSDYAMDVVWDGSETIAPDFCTLCGNEILCPFCGQPSDASIALEVDDPDYEINEKGEGVIEAEKMERQQSGAGS